MCQILNSIMCMISLCDNEAEDGVYQVPTPARLSGSKPTHLTTKLYCLNIVISGVLARAWSMGRRPQLRSISLCEHWKSVRLL